MKPWEQEYQTKEETAQAPPWEQEYDSSEKKEVPPWEQSYDTDSVAEDSQEGDLLVGKDIKPSELEEIAKRHGADVTLLKEISPYYGVAVEGDKGFIPTARRGIGMASEALGGLPTKLASYTLDEKTRDALDELNELAQKKKSYLQAGGEMLSTAVIPGVNAAKAGKTGVALVGALEGAAHGLGESKRGEELESTAVGGALGAAGGLIGAVLINKIWPGADKVIKDKDALKEIKWETETLDNLDEGVINTYIKDLEASPKFNEAVEASFQKLETNIPEAQKFIKYLEGKAPKNTKDTLSKLEELKERGGGDIDYLERRFKDYKAVEEFGLDQLNKAKDMGGYSISEELRKIGYAIGDGSQVGRAIDNKAGTSIQESQQWITRETDTLSRHLKAVVTSLRETMEVSRKENIDTSTLYRALDGDEEAKRLVGDTQTYKQLVEQFKDLRKEAGLKGLPIKEREDYIPHQLLPFREFIVKMDELKEVGENYLLENATSFKDYKKLLSNLESGKLEGEAKSAAEYLKGIEIGTGKIPDSPGQVAQFAKELEEPRALKGMYFSESAAQKQREGFIPESLRDTDVFRLATNWASSNLKHAYLREPLAHLRKQQKLLEKSGDFVASRWADNLYQDLVGVREGNVPAKFRQAMNKKVIQSYREAQKLPEGSFARRVKMFQADFPYAFMNLYSNMYPAFLGMSPRAALQNLTQPWTMTIPELGYVYGTKKVLSSYLETLRHMAKGSKIGKDSPALTSRLGDESGRTTRSLDKLLTQAGRMQTHRSAEMQAFMSGATDYFKKQGYTSKAIEKMQNASMTMFELAEKTNRFQTIHIANSIAEDLLKGKTSAYKFVKKGSKSLQSRVKRAVKANDSAELEKALQDYLIDRTMFNYNRANLTQMGRELGPLVTSFSKWPLSVAGATIQGFTERGVGGGLSEATKRLIGPTVGLWALQSALNRAGMDPEESDLAASLLSKEGLTRAGPLSNIKSVLSGDALMPPIVDFMVEPALAVVTADPEKLTKSVLRTGEAFIPMTQYMDALLDFTALMDGQKDESKTILGRAAERVGLPFEPALKDLKETIHD